MSTDTERPLKTMLTEGITAWLQRTIPPVGARRISSTALAISTDIGTTRTENQDRAVIGLINDTSNPVLFLALADGMGGMAQGGKCAAITLAAFTAELATSLDPNQESLLRNAAYFADYRVHKELQGNGGSTLSAIVIKPGQPPLTLNVGDSRIYAFSEMSVHRLTRDDTIEEQFKGIVDSKIAEAEKHRILQYIGMGSDLEPHIERADYVVDDILLTSDGANPCGTENLLRIRKNSESGTYVKRITELSKWLGSKDNVTAIAASDLHNALDRLSKSTENKSITLWDSFGERSQIIPEEVKSNSGTDNRNENTTNKRKSHANKKKIPERNLEKAVIDKKKRDQTEGSKEPKELQIEFFKGTQGE
ncbi:serine/threonine protein phosphatase PrpC [Marinobacter nauticus]|uniref:Serine/threonine protein phosphatase PrpC n=1 Tax=Marinobacter nauticus TaxID=2743 RepID=A0A368X4V8_MARNT|nr:protein phosphatase 2C domain-containing protein [Marinobacter nauticus]RCW62729.1 serine/threonine protein phosphatase PrpC [Marinobacter nauticus]